MAEIEGALAESREAVAEFVRHARAVEPARWAQPPAPGRWSPGQVAEHVAISYEASVAALRGRSALPALPRILRPLIRALFLGRLLRTGRFPRRAKAPPAFRPGPSPEPPETLLVRLAKGAAELDRECRSLAGGGKATLDHPIFGKLALPDYIRLNALHTRHHIRQLGA